MSHLEVKCVYEAQMTTAFEPNRSALRQLKDLGLPENGAIRGLLHTGNVDANRAAEWCFDHLDDPNFNLPLTNDELREASNAARMGALSGAMHDLREAAVPAVKLVFVVNNSLKMGES